MLFSQLKFCSELPSVMRSLLVLGLFSSTASAVGLEPCPESQIGEIIEKMTLPCREIISSTFFQAAAGAGKRALSHQPSHSPPPPPTATLTIDMNTGWTFLSLNVVADDMSINTIFNGLTLTQNDHFKNQHTFTDYYDGYVRNPAHLRLLKSIHLHPRRAPGSACRSASRSASTM